MDCCVVVRMLLCEQNLWYSEINFMRKNHIVLSGAICWLLLLHNFALVCNPMTPYVQKKYDSMIGTTTMRYAICVLAFFFSLEFFQQYVLLSWEQVLVLRFSIFGGFLNQGLLNRVSGTKKRNAIFGQNVIFDQILNRFF